MQQSSEPSPSAPTRRARWSGRIVTVLCLALVLGATCWILVTADGQVRFSADSDDTAAFWTRWVPALVGLLLVRLVPSDVVDDDTTDRQAVRRQAIVLLVLAVLFAVGLRLVGGGEPAHTVSKLVLLLGAPLFMFWWVRRRQGTATDIRPAGWGPWARYGPAIPVAAWLVTYGLLAVSPGDYGSIGLPVLVISMLGGFLLNSLLEEIFYRRWLLTRLEPLSGRWAAIMLTAVLWSAWHIGIQSVGDLGVDLASALTVHGVQGIFLGYLWSRYRLMWPIVVVHGAVNSLTIFAFWL